MASWRDASRAVPSYASSNVLPLQRRTPGGGWRRQGLRRPLLNGPGRGVSTCADDRRGHRAHAVDVQDARGHEFDLLGQSSLVGFQLDTEGDDDGHEGARLGPCDAASNAVALSGPPALDRRDSGSGQRGACIVSQIEGGIAAGAAWPCKWRSAPPRAGASALRLKSSPPRPSLGVSPYCRSQMTTA